MAAAARADAATRQRDAVERNCPSRLWAASAALSATTRHRRARVALEYSRIADIGSEHAAPPERAALPSPNFSATFAFFAFFFSAFSFFASLLPLLAHLLLDRLLPRVRRLLEEVDEALALRLLRPADLQVAHVEHLLDDRAVDLLHRRQLLLALRLLLLVHQPAEGAQRASPRPAIQRRCRSTAGAASSARRTRRSRARSCTRRSRSRRALAAARARRDRNEPLGSSFAARPASQSESTRCASARGGALGDRAASRRVAPPPSRCRPSVRVSGVAGARRCGVGARATRRGRRQRRIDVPRAAPSSSTSPRRRRCGASAATRAQSRPPPRSSPAVDHARSAVHFCRARRQGRSRGTSSAARTCRCGGAPSRLGGSTCCCPRAAMLELAAFCEARGALVNAGDPTTPSAATTRARRRPRGWSAAAWQRVRDWWRRTCAAHRRARLRHGLRCRTATVA